MREAAVITVYFPLIVALGAGMVVTPKVERLCRFSGDLSYPLYMTHYSVMWIWSDFAEKYKLASRGLGPTVAVGVFSMVLVAWAIFRLYDQPVRAYLRRRL